MSKRAILAVDLQNEYLPSGKLPLTGIETAVANAARVIAGGRSHADTVIHIRHEAPSPDFPFFVPNSTGAKIIDDVLPRDGEAVLVKNFPNSFRGTALAQTLTESGIETVVIVGAMSHMCIDATARAAADLGYQTFVIHDACATLDLEFEGVRVRAGDVHAAQMAALAFGYAAVHSTERWLEDSMKADDASSQTVAVP